MTYSGVQKILQVIRLSRPLFWIYTGGLFILGAVIGAMHSATVVPWGSWSFLGALLWFALGENFFGVLLNDYYDRDADALNPRKRIRYEDSLWWPLAGLVVLSAIAFGILAIRVGGVMLWTYGIVFFAVNILYDVPPVRLKGRPPFDLIIGAGCALPPLFAGYSLVSGAWPPLWAVIVGGVVWVGFDLFDKLFDADADAAAGITTSAVWLGVRAPAGLQYRWFQWSFMIIGTLITWYVWYLYFFS